MKPHQIKLIGLVFLLGVGAIFQQQVVDIIRKRV